mmetsp:Transcript_47346/g.56951  ORF Transcript_47346/g.56951 Transcript_47346/m.56951 type:complete len:227 (-) Transcript_47346:513-1193(-)
MDEACSRGCCSDRENHIELRPTPDDGASVLLLFGSTLSVEATVVAVVVLRPSETALIDDQKAVDMAVSTASISFIISFDFASGAVSFDPSSSSVGWSLAIVCCCSIFVEGEAVSVVSLFFPSVIVAASVVISSRFALDNEEEPLFVLVTSVFSVFAFKVSETAENVDQKAVDTAVSTFDTCLLKSASDAPVSFASDVVEADPDFSLFPSVIGSVSPVMASRSASDN